MAMSHLGIVTPLEAPTCHRVRGRQEATEGPGFLAMASLAHFHLACRKQFPIP
jgi:hypothetical protein